MENLSARDRAINSFLGIENPPSQTEEIIKDYKNRVLKDITELCSFLDSRNRTSHPFHLIRGLLAYIIEVEGSHKKYIELNEYCQTLKENYALLQHKYESSNVIHRLEMEELKKNLKKED